MSKREQLEMKHLIEVAKRETVIAKGLSSDRESVSLPIDIVLQIIEQAERVEYYKFQSERKTEALEEIVNLLTEDWFENWDEAVEVALKHKRDYVRADKFETDSEIRTEDIDNE